MQTLIFLQKSGRKRGFYDSYSEKVFIASDQKEMRLSIFILAKNAFSKCFWELKNTLVFLFEIDSSQIYEKNRVLSSLHGGSITWNYTYSL